MNTLSSWIDAADFAETARQLLPAGMLGKEFAALESGLGPGIPLGAGDFTHAPAAPEPPAAVAADISDAEKQRLRNLLEEAKRKAAHSGLLRPAAPVAPPAQPPPSAPEMQTPPSASPAAGGSGPLAPAAAANVSAAAAPADAADQDAVLSRRGIPYFTPPLGPLGTRLRAFSDWLQRHVPVMEFFIVDGQGCPVSDHEPAPSLLAAALLLSDAARRAGRHVSPVAEGALHLDLEAGRKLCVIHTETSYGHFCLGMVCAEPLPAKSAERLRGALRRTLEAESAKPPHVRVEK
jgi:hypothetical protein